MVTGATCWKSCSILRLGEGESPKLNTACVGNQFRLRWGCVSLLLAFMVKAILLELQFLGPSNVGASLANCGACLFDAWRGKFVAHSSQKCRAMISRVKGMNEVPKNAADRNVQNAGWPKGSQPASYGYRVVIVTRTPLHCRGRVKVDSQHCYNVGKGLFNFSATSRVITRRFTVKASIPPEFVAFQSKCTNWKGPITEDVYKFLLNPRRLMFAYSKMRRARVLSMGGGRVNIGRVQEILGLLKSESFQFSPGSRECGKGFSGCTGLLLRDAVVLEAIRMVLEAVYEPTFSRSSHGFRTAGTCHTALRQVREEFGVASWYVKGDFSNCFSSFSQHQLMLLIEAKILDRKICLLYTSPSPRDRQKSRMPSSA